MYWASSDKYVIEDTHTEVWLYLPWYSAEESQCDVFLHNSHLTIKQRRVVVDVRDLNCEGADALQGRITIVRCLDGHGDKLAILTLTVKHLIGCHFTCLWIYCELGAFLVGLLDNTVAYLE